MSIESVSAVLNADLPITPTAKLVLIGIANHDGDGGAWPSVNTLARYASVTPRSVQRALSDLEAAGLITRHVNQGGTSRTPDHSRPNLYELHVSPGDASVTPPPDADVTPPPDASVTPPVTPVSPEPSLNLSTEPPVESSAELALVAECDFETWYAGFPKKEGRHDASKLWKKLSPEDRQAACDALPRWQEYASLHPEGATYVNNAGTWLRQRKWEDDTPMLPKTRPASVAEKNAAIATAMRQGARAPQNSMLARMRKEQP